MRRRRPASELRTAIDCLPLESRQAMLEGIAVNRIIVGAYVDRQGGVCPMLAAHREGGRTSLASFAHAWDRYTRAGKGPRPATERELRTLQAMLEASIAADEPGTPGSVAHATPDHERPARPAHRPSRPRRDTGERNRTPELRRRHGWAWLRLFRRLDEYEDALRRVEARQPEPDRPREPV